MNKEWWEYNAEIPETLLNVVYFNDEECLLCRKKVAHVILGTLGQNTYFGEIRCPECKDGFSVRDPGKALDPGKLKAFKFVLIQKWQWRLYAEAAAENKRVRNGEEKR